MQTKLLHLAASLFLAGLITPSLHSQTFTFTTIAGGAQGSLDGVNSNSQFYNPTGAVIDGAGNVYVADQNNNLIRKISPLGTNWVVSTIVGGAQGSADGTNASARFFGPTGIAIDNSGSLYVADQYNSVIRKVSLTGSNWVVTTIAGMAGVTGLVNGTNAAARFFNPTGIAVDASGNVFIADEANNAIRKIAPVGTNWVVTTLAGGTQGTNNGTNTAAQFSNPAGVAVDSAGRIFVADQFNNMIRLITPAGTNWVVTTIAGETIAGRLDGLGTNAHFHAPLSVAVDSNTNVYVADLFNNAIRKLAPSGTNWTVTTIGGGSSGFTDGTGTNARFYLPYGVAADPFGDILIADTYNNAIRLGVATTNPPATGGLQVFITPPGAISGGARWQLDSGALQVSGAVLAALVPGDHSLKFSGVSGFTTPAVQIVTVTAHLTAAATGNYPAAVPNAGSLQVMLSPVGSVNAGAQWQVDGGALQTNGAIVAGLSVGAHTVSFNTLAGWTTPSSQQIAITNSQTTAASGIYVLQTGSLQVSIFPTAVVNAGAKWQVDGGTFQTNTATLLGLLPGNHTIAFNTVLGWNTPASQLVVITNATLTAASNIYSPTVTNAPSQLSNPVLSGGNFQFVLTGAVGTNYVVQVSSNLVTWAAISTNTLSQTGTLLVTVAVTNNSGRNFYRAVTQ